MVVCSVCLFCFVANLPDFCSLKKKIEALIELRKILLRKKLFEIDVRLSSTPKALIFYRFTGFTKIYKTLFQNEVK